MSDSVWYIVQCASLLRISFTNHREKNKILIKKIALRSKKMLRVVSRGGLSMKLYILSHSGCRKVVETFYNVTAERSLTARGRRPLYIKGIAGAAAIRYDVRRHAYKTALLPFSFYFVLHIGSAAMTKNE